MVPVYVRFGRTELVLELDERVKLRVDALGRWLSYRDERGFYRRLLSGAVVTMGSAVCDENDPAAIHRRVRDATAALQNALNQGCPLAASGRDAPQGDDARRAAQQWLERVAGWDESRYAEQAALFRQAYPEAVPILPPDRSRDVVVLPAVGCPYARCRFCAFYGQSNYRPLSQNEFALHLERVSALLGPGLEERTGIFLGSANALALGQRRLVQVLSETRRSMGPRRISAFWDPDHSPDRDPAAFSELATGGLDAVYVGLETGHPELRRKLGKGAQIDEFVRRVKNARTAGLKVGVSVLAGFTAQSLEHETRTVDALSAMDLARSDVVFVSPLIGSSGARRAAETLTRALALATHARVAPYAPERHRYAS